MTVRFRSPFFVWFFWSFGFCYGVVVVEFGLVRFLIAEEAASEWLSAR